MYRILIKKLPNVRLPEWLDSVETFDPGDREDIISVDITDQTALRDLLFEARNLGFSLISVVRVESPEEPYTEEAASN